MFGLLHVARMLLILMAAVVLMLMLFEKRLLYHPDRALEATPRAAGLAYEDLTIRTPDGLDLHAWFLPHPRPRATLLFLHGNAGNISHRVPKAARLHALGLNVLLLDYRGYGRSQGAPSELGTYRDARAAWDALRAHPAVQPDRIVCFGESLGGAVAIHLATAAPCRALVVESSFTSVPDMAVHVFKVPLLRWIVASRYDSLSKLPRLSAPVLFLHGQADDLVPCQHAERNFAAAREPKELWLVPGAGHNDLYLAAGPAWAERIGAFLDRALSQAQSGGPEAAARAR